MRDDGVIVYVNGVEVFREGLPDGEVGPTTYATQSVWGGNERDPLNFTIPADVVTAGTNTIAVAIHNESGQWSRPLVRPRPPYPSCALGGYTVSPHHGSGAGCRGGRCAMGWSRLLRPRASSVSSSSSSDAP